MPSSVRVGRGIFFSEMKERMLGGQVVDPDHAIVTQHHHALDEVLQLADVARPVVLPEVDHGVVRHLALPALVLGVVLVEEVLHQHRDVGAPFAQRRQQDGITCRR